MTYRAAFVSVLFVSLVAGCSQPPAQNPPAPPPAAPAAPVVSTATTAEVLARHQKTFGAGDLEGVLADYATDAAMFSPGGTVKGSAELRKTFEGILAEWGKPGTTFKMNKEIVDGAHAYTYWDAETADNVYEGATDVFVVNNGKIVAHFFAGKITPKKK
ncbi:MAG: nuclear transport factor 2 family protein [Candidatus Hydrogenedentales bacterium]